MSPLDPSPDDFRRWGQKALESMEEYLRSRRDGRLYPKTTSKEICSHFDTDLPRDGAGFDKILETFCETVIPLTRQSGHRRMFGYVQSPSASLGVMADFLASTLNANLTAWRSAPAPVDLERLTIEWIRQIIGLPGGAAGLFVSGGSMANLNALAVARRAKAGPDFMPGGERSLPRALKIYISQETHHSVAKAAALLGLGTEAVRHVPVDRNLKLQTDRLREMISADLQAGHQPFCVVANAGTVMTGAVDPLAEIARIAQEFQLWMHVDACYGGFAVMAPSARALFDGIDQADSIALDPHKWLYAPMDCGCVLYRDPATARATFAHDAEYTRVFQKEKDEAFAFWDYGPELSRRFRALKVWAILKGAGTNALGEAIEKNIACARYLESLVAASDVFEMLAPVELSIFCFRYLPPAFRKGAPRDDRATANLNEFNERLLLALQLDGNSYLSNALIDGQFALRGCVLNFRTTERDMEILLEDLQRLAPEIC